MNHMDHGISEYICELYKFIVLYVNVRFQKYK